MYIYISARSLWKFTAELSFPVLLRLRVLLCDFRKLLNFVRNFIMYLIGMYSLQSIYSCSVVLGFFSPFFFKLDCQKVGKFLYIHFCRSDIWFGMKGRRGMSFSLQMIYFLCLGIKPIFLFPYYISFLWLKPEVTAFPLVWFAAGLFSFQGLLSTDSSSPEGTFLLDANPGVFTSFWVSILKSA